MKLLVHGMIGFALIAVFVLGVSLDQARAQGAAQPPPAVEPVVEEPAPAVKSTPETAAPIVESVPAAPAPTMDPTAAITYQTRPTTIDGHTMEELNNRVRRVRIALFSSSGVFAAGLAVAIAGATQCETINDQTFCNSTGDALFSASAAFIVRWRHWHDHQRYHAGGTQRETAQATTGSALLSERAPTQMGPGNVASRLLRRA